MTLAENYEPVIVQLTVSKGFERIIQKHFSGYIDDLSGYWKDF